MEFEKVDLRPRNSFRDRESWVLFRGETSRVRDPRGQIPRFSEIVVDFEIDSGSSAASHLQPSSGVKNAP